MKTVADKESLQKQLDNRIWGYRVVVEWGNWPLKENNPDHVIPCGRFDVVAKRIGITDVADGETAEGVGKRFIKLLRSTHKELARDVKHTLKINKKPIAFF